MSTIGQLARSHGLSRSTLLYYDRLGLLRPSGRSAAGYRIYTQADAARLAQIGKYRQAGLSLADIQRLLDAPENDLVQILEKRLGELNGEIDRLRGQQRFILGLLRSDKLREQVGVMNKQTWTSLLQAAGFTEADMFEWHVQFECTAPDKHRQFLEFLCIPPAEIEFIRSWAHKTIAQAHAEAMEKGFVLD